MSTCDKLVGLLSEYLDGRLSPDEQHDLDEHLGGCSECTAFVGTFRSTISLLQSLTDDDLPEELRVRLRAFLDDRWRS